MERHIAIWWQGLAFFLGVMLFPEGAAALDCTKAVTQREIEKCVQDEFDAANRKLESAYKRYSAALSGRDRELLQRAQETWERYRDANCEASAATFAGGTLAPTEFAACKSKLTRERLEELRRIYEEPPFPAKQ